VSPIDSIKKPKEYVNKSVLNQAKAAGLAMPRAAPAHTHTGKSVVSVSVTFSSVERWPNGARSPEAAVETDGLLVCCGSREKGKEERVRRAKKEERTERARSFGEPSIAALELDSKKSPDLARFSRVSNESSNSIRIFRSLFTHEYREKRRGATINEARGTTIQCADERKTAKKSPVAIEVSIALI